MRLENGAFSRKIEHLVDWAIVVGAGLVLVLLGVLVWYWVV